jgi:endogenous inhibitor of DNA gyrase (YacG/DUF329 family)
VSSSGQIIVECPRCGATYEAWALSAPVLGMDPQLGDPGWIKAQTSATCPECGKSSCCGGLAANRDRDR